jgi:predicted negative regulator of RcsB-dependent stress response
MSEATQSIEQTLNKTDFGHLIYEKRKLFIGLIIVVLIGATAYVGWEQMKKSEALNTSVQVFEFQSGIWSDVKTGKKEVSELVTAFNALDAKTQKAPVMLPVVMEISKFLSDKGNNAEADAILSKLTGSTNGSMMTFFVSMQRAVVLEKLGKIDEATKMLEPLAQSKDVLMPAKVSVELGRLYLAQGEKGKAQTQFDYVINTYPNEEQAKIAKLYLSQITK